MTTTRARRPTSVWLYAALAVLAVALPLVLSLPELAPIVGAQRRNAQLLEFFGLSGFLAVLCGVAWAIRTREPQDVLDYLDIVMPAVVALLWLVMLVASPSRGSITTC